MLSAFLSVESSRSQPAKGDPLSAVKFDLKKGRGLHRVTQFALLVDLNLVRVLLEPIDLRLGPCLPLLRSLDHGVHVCDGPPELS